MTYVRELPPEGLPGREYTLTVGDVTGTTEFFVAREHIYVMLVMGKPGADWPREKFFASFRASSDSSGPPTIASGGIGSGVRGVSPDPTAIPWLLLSATKTTAGRGGHLLSDTTFIQRLNTTGGLAPAGTCTSGQTAAVPYTADYYFWKAKSA